jgi:branched-chain amino acid transport system substrate-binding protein
MRCKRIVLIGGVCLTMIVSVAMPPKAYCGGPPIKLGLVAPMTGPLAISGERESETAKIIVKHINETGGILGRPVELFVRDSAASPKTAIKAIRELHDAHGVNFFIGISSSMVATTVIPLLKELGVIGIGHAMSDSLTGSKGGPNFFRVTMNAYLPNRGLADLMREKYPNVKKWATISHDYSYGHTNWKAFSERFKEIDPEFRIVADGWVKFGAGGGYGPHVTKVLDAHTEGLYTSLVGSDWIAFVRESKRYGLFDKIKVFAHGNLIFSETAPLKSEMVECWAYTHFYDRACDNPDSRWLKEAYSAEYGAVRFAETQTWVSVTYDQIKAYREAMEKAGSADVERVRKALEGLRYKGTKGEIWIRPETHQGIFPLIYVHVVPDPKHPIGWSIDKWEIKNGQDYILPVEVVKQM